MEFNRKFEQTIDINDWEVETNNGWKDISKFGKTIPYKVWELKTKTKSLKCADTHIVYNHKHEEIFVKDLKVGDYIITKSGFEEVIYLEEFEYEENMFDITVDDNKHMYYTNDILSHNSTIMTIYIVWYSLFHKDVTSIILANKLDTAIEILDRCQIIYENLPFWFQPGIKDGGWNKTSIELSTGSKIKCFASSASAIRGKTVNLLAIDEFAFLPNNDAESFIKSVFPTISSAKNEDSSQIILVSTPNGMNHFQKLWSNANKKPDEIGYSRMIPYYAPWTSVPGRGEEYKKARISEVGTLGWTQEYLCLGGNSIVNVMDENNNIYKISISELSKMMMDNIDPREIKNETS